MTDLSPEARRLVDASRHGDEPTDADRARVLSRVMAAVAAPVAPGADGASAGDVNASSAASANTAAVTSSAAKLLVVLGIAGVAAGALWWQRSEGVYGRSAAAVGADPTLAAPPQAASSPPRPRLEPTEAVAAAADQTQRGIGPPATPVAESIAQSAGAPTASDRTDDARPERLRQGPGFDTEIALVGKAQRALARGDARAALRLARRHAAQFTDGDLRQERDAVRVRALCQLRRASAGKARDAFLRQWPGSVYADAISAECDDR